MTYSRVGSPHYHRRWTFSLPSSEWDRVVPARYCRQANRYALALAAAPNAQFGMIRLVALCASITQTVWVLYGQASRAISTG